jgi:hypothetical protein
MKRRTLLELAMVINQAWRAYLPGGRSWVNCSTSSASR